MRMIWLALNARRLHGAQRDDSGLPEQRGLESDGRSHRRSVVAVGGDVEVLPAGRELPSSPGPTLLARARSRSEPARLVRMAPDRGGRGGKREWPRTRARAPC